MDYATLKADIAAWLDRADLTARIPSFVRLAEARIARDALIARSITTATLTVPAGQSSVALPADFAAGVEVAGLTGYSYASPQLFGDPGLYDAYTLTGGYLRLSGAVDADTDVTLTYYARTAALSADGDTNHLLTTHPGLYLYCALAEASVFLQDDARTPLWEAKYRKELEDVRSANWGEYFSAEQYAQSAE